MKRFLLICLLIALVACGGGEPTPDLAATIAAQQLTIVAQSADELATAPLPTTQSPTNEAAESATLPPAPTNAPTRAPSATLVIPTVDPNAPLFYVATDGNDETGTGSAESPWATITRALDSVSDGSVILVRPGLYEGRVRIRGQFANGVTVRSEIPYQARLRAMETVLTIFEAQGITIEGFDVAHSGPGAEPIVVQIQDLMGEAPGGAEFTSRITLRNNILHDAYDNDILKINNAAQQIAIIGNLFYNQGDSDEHIDINSVQNVLIEGNLFFNDFGASGRPISGESSNYIVIKDSNGDEDGIVGTRDVAIRQNLFFNWQGNEGSNFILLGEDGNSYYEAEQITIENNLILGNSGGRVRAPFGFKGVHEVFVRHNTVLGDMPSGAFALRSNVEGENQPNDAIVLQANIFADPTGTMELLATAPEGETADLQLQGNLYWNGGQPIPTSEYDVINVSADASAILGDPRLPDPANLVAPSWDGAQFADGSVSIGEAFTRIVQNYAIPASDSAALGGAEGGVVTLDLLGQARPADSADVGAYQVQNGEKPLQPPADAPTNIPAPAEEGSSDTGGGEPAEETGGGEVAAVGPESAELWQSDSPAYFAYTINQGDTNTLYLLEVAEGATPRDLSAELGVSGWVTLSGNGAWLLTNSEQLDPECAGWPCLALYPREGGAGEILRTPNGPARSEGVGAVSRDGSAVAFRDGGGAHERDVWVTQRTAGGWSEAVAISADSTYSYHSLPVFSADGQKLLFVCSDDPYDGAAICEANRDGSGFRVVVTAEEGGSAESNLLYPTYEADGSILFEANWQDGEQIWRIPSGGGELSLVAPLFSNDNAPCVLSDGRILSLWLQRVGNDNGSHEVKVMSADGSRYAMLLTGVDVFDIGMGCGQ